MGFKEKTKYEDSYEFSNHEGQQYVSFKIAGETYMVDIKKVREFITYDRISIIPNLPEHYKGVINLRGSIIPVMDLRLRFGYPQLEYNERTVLMTIFVEDKLIGMVVDKVLDVINLPSENLQPPPETEMIVERQFLEGLCEWKGEMLILLNLDSLFAQDKAIQALISNAENSN